LRAWLRRVAAIDTHEAFLTPWEPRGTERSREPRGLDGADEMSALEGRSRACSIGTANLLATPPGGPEPPAQSRAPNLSCLGCPS
jgi:hypothetical protein